MSRKTVKVVTNVTRQADDQQDLVAALRGLGTSDTRIKLFKYANYPARPEYIDDIELEIVTTGSLEQFLKEKYGSGSYLARGFANGQWVKEGSRVIHIHGEKKEEAVVVKNGNGDSDMWKFILSNQQQSSDRMMALMQASNNTMMQVFSAIVAAQKPMDLAGIAAMMQQLKPPGGMNETIEMMTKVVDLTAKLGGGGGEAAEPDPMMMMLGAGLDLIKGRASLPAPAPPPPQQQQPAPGAAPGAPVQNPSQQQQPQQQPATAWSQQQVLEDRLRFLTMLKKKAQLGKEVGDWADYIEDNQDDHVCIWLLSMVRGHPWETIEGALVQTDPEIGTEPCATWFHELYESLRGEDADAVRKVNTAS